MSVDSLKRGRILGALMQGVWVGIGISAALIIGAVILGRVVLANRNGFGKTPSYVILGIIVLVVLGALAYIVMSIRWIRDPMQHPSLADLKRFGESASLLSGIETELATPEVTLQSLILTRQWIVNFWNFSVVVIPYVDVAKLWTVTKSQGSSKTYFVRVDTKSGRKHELRVFTEADAERGVAEIAARQQAVA